MPVTVARAIRVGLAVGTLVVALNHTDSIMAGHCPAWWKVVLSYVVPYCASSYSTAMFICDNSTDQSVLTVEMIE